MKLFDERVLPGWRKASGRLSGLPFWVIVVTVPVVVVGVPDFSQSNDTAINSRSDYQRARTDPTPSPFPALIKYSRMIHSKKTGNIVNSEAKKMHVIYCCEVFNPFLQSLNDIARFYTSL